MSAQRIRIPSLRQLIGDASPEDFQRLAHPCRRAGCRQRTWAPAWRTAARIWCPSCRYQPRARSRA